MTIRNSLYFLYNGQSSADFGITNVNISGGMLDEPFMATSHINEVKIRGKDKPYFTTITHDPLSFNLTLAFTGIFDGSKLRAVARWLNAGFYKTLQFSDNPDRLYYAILDSEPRLVHTGSSQGYISLTMRTDSPYSFSPTYTFPIIYDLSSNPVNGTVIKLNNLGDVSFFPEVYLNKIGNGEVEIINLSNNSTSFKYSYILPNPTVVPIISQVANAGSTLPAVMYYIRYTWAGISGETNVSTEVTFTLSAGFNLVITIPALPSGATFGAFYIGTSAGTGTKQGTSATTSFTISAPLVVGASAPTSNTTGLMNNENVYTDCANQIITSDQIPVVYRMNNFNNNYLEIVYGQNNLLVLGNVKIKFRYQFIYLQG